jgi:N6-adenosine-specific RNA methylase IME4
MTMFDGFPKKHYGAILADPPWAFNLWWGNQSDKAPAAAPSRATVPHYQVMREDELSAIPVSDIAADNSVLIMWTCWPVLEWSLRVMRAWGFEYKTCGFCWVKAHAGQIDMFRDDIDPHMTLGYWTRSNSEMALLGTRGKPKRRAADVRQAIIEPRREHSRKPDCVHRRIERLVAGPYLELFARQKRPGWDCWGAECDKFPAVKEYDPDDDIRRSVQDCLKAVKVRVDAGGKGWGGYPPEKPE